MDWGAQCCMSQSGVYAFSFRFRCSCLQNVASLIYSNFELCWVVNKMFYTWKCVKWSIIIHRSLLVVEFGEITIHEFWKMWSLMHFVSKQWKGINSLFHIDFCCAHCQKSFEKVNSVLRNACYQLYKKKKIKKNVQICSVTH